MNKPYQHPGGFAVEDYLVTVHVMEQNNPMGEVHPYLESRIYEEMRMSLADTVANANVTKNKGEFKTDYRMEVYVIPPDVLHKLIRDEAQRLTDTYRYMPYVEEK